MRHRRLGLDLFCKSAAKAEMICSWGRRGKEMFSVGEEVGEEGGEGCFETKTIGDHVRE